MNTNNGKIGSLVIGLYAWIASVTFGASLLDVMYAELLPDALESDVFSEIADFLLVLVAFTFLAGMGAIGFAWMSTAARYLLAVSLFIIVFGLFVPVLFSSFIQDAHAGKWIRLILAVLPSILALPGWYKFLIFQKRKKMLKEGIEDQLYLTITVYSSVGQSISCDR